MIDWCRSAVLLGGESITVDGDAGQVLLATSSPGGAAVESRKLHFRPGSNTGDPDQRVLSHEDLQQAQQEGEEKG
jgi:hypothetical protein